MLPSSMRGTSLRSSADWKQGAVKDGSFRLIQSGVACDGQFGRHACDVVVAPPRAYGQAIHPCMCEPSFKDACFLITFVLVSCVTGKDSC